MNKNTLTKRCQHCEGSGLLYSGDPNALGTASSTCDACNGKGRIDMQQNSVSKLVERLEQEPGKGLTLFFTFGSVKQPVGTLSIYSMFNGAQVTNGVLFQSESGHEVVDESLAETLLPLIPERERIAA